MGLIWEKRDVDLWQTLQTVGSPEVGVELDFFDDKPGDQPLFKVKFGWKYLSPTTEARLGRVLMDGTRRKLDGHNSTSPRLYGWIVQTALVPKELPGFVEAAVPFRTARGAMFYVEHQYGLVQRRLLAIERINGSLKN